MKNSKANKAKYNAETLAAMREALDISNGKIKSEQYFSFDDLARQLGIIFSVPPAL